jgi:ketol-acid reductoisomerase
LIKNAACGARCLFVYITLDVQTMETLMLEDSSVLGYGSQGRGQALNLRDSGLDVRIGLRTSGRSQQRAESDGFRVVPIASAVREADLVAMLVPDTAQSALYGQAIAPNLRSGATLLFSHGFNIRYGTIKPREDLDVVMVAPKGPGNLVRETYESGLGVPCLIAVHQNSSGRARATALLYAHALGASRAGILETTFAEETETDLFGEQAVLCGGMSALVKMGFETLVEAGYQPEVAYFECLHELKLIVDLVQRAGLAGMRAAISETAKYGDVTRGPRVVDGHARAAMREVLAEIRDGTFAREWIDEARLGAPKLEALLAADVSHPIEMTGEKLRRSMQWLKRSPEAAPAGRPA